MFKIFSPLMLAGLLTACGGAESNFVSACEDSSDMTTENCECLAGHASKEMPDHGLEFITAMIEEDEDQLRKLREDLPASEYLKMGMFMMTAPVKCAISMETWNADE